MYVKIEHKIYWMPPSSIEREIYATKCMHQKRGKVKNKLFKFLPKESRKKKNYLNQSEQRKE